MTITIGILVGAAILTGIGLGWTACSLYSRRILLCACGHAPGQGDRYTGICLGKRRERKYANGRRVWVMVACGCHMHGDLLHRAAEQLTATRSGAFNAALLNGDLRDHVGEEMPS